MKWQAHSKKINKYTTKIFLLTSNRDTNPNWLNQKKKKKKGKKSINSHITREVQSILSVSKDLSRGETTCSEPSFSFSITQLCPW